MKWTAFILCTLLLSACYNTKVIEYRQVVVAPPYETVSVVYDEPIDVTDGNVSIDYFDY